MKLKTVISLTSAAAIALFASNPALAKEPSAVEAEVEAAIAPGAPALWEVSDEDTTIYLFGTVHMLPDDVAWNSGRVNEALAGSETLVTEIEMTPELEQQAAIMFQQKGALPAGKTLRSLMTEEQRKTYEEGIAKIGLSAEMFDPLEPWLASIVMLQIASQASGFTPDKGVETVLEAAVSKNTKRVGLETVEFQVKVFDEMPLEEQLTYFLEFAADPVQGIKDLNTLVDEWAEGDVDAVGNLMNDALVNNPILAERLLFARNRNWAEWIHTRLDTPGTVFMAVGAGHLAGEKSVQDHLEERGIMTKRVQ